MTEPPPSRPLSPAKRALLERALAERRAAAAASLQTIPRRTDGGPAPLSFAQQRMWFLQQWEPGSPTFNGVRAFRLRGRLDRQELTGALSTIISRHESLRTVIIAEPEPKQRALEEWTFEVPVLGLSATPGDPGREHELRALLRSLAREPFDLTTDLSLRASLVELGPEEHVLLLRMHHIAADAHSDRVILAELAEVYNARLSGRAPRLPELPIQYADYAVWQRDHLQGKTLERLIAYWASQLDGAPARLVLPTDGPRPAIQRHVGAHHEFALDRELGERLRQLARDQQATFFMAALAAFATLLYRLSGQEDIVLGSPIANRNHAQLQGLIGFFTNTIALRTRLGGSPSFRQVVDRARATALGAYAHQELPFEKVVERLAPRRDPGWNPIFQVNFRAQEAGRPALELTGLQAEPISVDIGFSRFDLALELELRPGVLAGYFESDEDLFRPATVEAFTENFAALLEQVLDDPDVPVLAVRLPHGGRAAPPGKAIRRRPRV